MESQNGPPPGDAFSTHFISICFLMAPEASRRFLEVFRKVVYIFVQSGSGCPIIKTAPYIYIYIYIYIHNYNAIPSKSDCFIHQGINNNICWQSSGLKQHNFQDDA